jgi:hypothetical protein
MKAVLDRVKRLRLMMARSPDGGPLLRPVIRSRGTML